MREKDDEGTGHRSGIPEGQEQWVPAQYPPFFWKKKLRSAGGKVERAEGLRHSELLGYCRLLLPREVNEETEEQ